MRTVPWLTPTRPVIARISVVLPAPFGPSRPVTPGPNEQLSSDSATFGPNHTDTSATSTVASAANAGSSARRRRVAASATGISAPPSGSGAAARRSPTSSTTTYVDDRAAGRRWSTPASGDSGSMWPRNTRSRRYSGSASTLIERGGRAAVAVRSSPTMIADEIDVTRNRPMTAAPATMRRSVSDAIATPTTA